MMSLGLFARCAVMQNQVVCWIGAHFLRSQVRGLTFPMLSPRFRYALPFLQLPEIKEFYSLLCTLSPRMCYERTRRRGRNFILILSFCFLVSVYIRPVHRMPLAPISSRALSAVHALKDFWVILPWASAGTLLNTSNRWSQFSIFSKFYSRATRFVNWQTFQKTYSPIYYGWQFSVNPLLIFYLQLCHDVDECNDGRNGGCSVFSTCINTQVSY